MHPNDRVLQVSPSLCMTLDQWLWSPDHIPFWCGDSPSPVWLLPTFIWLYHIRLWAFHATSPSLVLFPNLLMMLLHLIKKYCERCCIYLLFALCGSSSAFVLYTLKQCFRPFHTKIVLLSISQTMYVFIHFTHKSCFLSLHTLITYSLISYRSCFH